MAGSLDANRRTGQRGAVLSILAIVVLGLAFHLPRLAKPLGIADSNAGAFIGVFLNNWEDHGFASLRGVPIWRQRVFAPDQAAAEPYVKHPPGLFWTTYALGTDETALRLPSLIGALLAAVCLCLLLRPHVGAWPALAGGLCLLGTPSVALYSQASYETVSLGAGLLLWLAVLRGDACGGRVRVAWLATAGLTAFVGTWLDWSFGMFCLGLVPLTASRSLRTWLGRLAVPAIAAGLAAATILAWQSWALDGERLNADAVAALRAGGLGELLRITILTRPSLGQFLTSAAHFVPTTAGPAVALAALPGVVLLARRAPRLTLALAVAGAHFVLFAGHGVDHPHFYCFQTALLAASVAALGLLRLPRAVLAIGLTALAGSAWWASARATTASDTSFFRDLGATLTRAAEADGGDANGDAGVHVATNCWPVFAYYVATPHAYVIPVLDAGALGRHRKVAGYRYLWFKDVRFGPGQNPANTHLRPDPALAAFLEPFASERVPALERVLREPCYGLDVDIREVRLVTVPLAQ